VDALYHNNGDGILKMTNSADGSIPPELAAGDYTNDGFLDIVDPRHPPTQLATFSSRQPFSGARQRRRINGGRALGDFDNDGFRSLLLEAPKRRGNQPALPQQRQRQRLIKPLVGTFNRSAIGAKVRVQATIGGKTSWQMREINTGCLFITVPLEAHFGLGTQPIST
jgi:hypothetical protein